MKHWIFALCLLCTLSEGILDVAQRYLGIPYVAGTLETEGTERLVINEDSLDCTTFVELTVAHWLDMKSDSLTFAQQVQYYAIGTEWSMDTCRAYITLPTG